jgi:hypothetical protein
MKTKKKPVGKAKVTKLTRSKKVATPKANLRDLLLLQLEKNDKTGTRTFTSDKFSDESGSWINIQDSTSEYVLELGFNYEGTEATDVNVFKVKIVKDEVKVF